MVFLCPPREEAEKKNKLLCELKNLVNEMEGKCRIECKMCCMPKCCTPCCQMPPQQPKTEGKCSPPNAMVCYRVCDGKSESKPEKKSEKKCEDSKKDGGKKKLKQSKSRELRGGNLYVGCHCEKRNGLQDDCPRSECHGSPPCLTKPPTCGPSKFCDAKHLLKAQKERLEMRAALKKGGGTAGSSGKSESKKDTSVKYQCFPAYIAPECFCMCPKCC